MLSDFRRKGGRCGRGVVSSWPLSFLAVITTLIGVVMLVGWLFAVPLLTSVGVAIPTTIVFLLLGGNFVIWASGARWALGRAVTVAFIGAMTVLIVIGLLNYRKTGELLKAAAWTEHTQQVMAQIGSVWRGFDELLGIERAFALTAQESYLNGYDATFREFALRQRALRKLTADNPQQQDWCSHLESILAARLSFSRKIVAARRAGGLEKAVAQISTGQGEELTSQVRSILRNMESEERSLKVIREKDATALRQETFLILPAGTLFGILGLVLALFRLNRESVASREKGEILHLLIDGAQDYAIFAIDPDGYVVSWNAGAQRIKGYSADEIIGTHISRFYPPSERAKGIPERELRLAREQGRVECEGLRVRKDGTLFWANATITAMRGERGELRGFSKVTRDITERKQAQEAMRNTHQQAISELVESIGDGFVAFDRDWRYIQVNSAAGKLLRVEPAELIGKVLWDVYPEVARLRFGAEYRRAMAENVSVQFEDYYPAPLDAWFEVRCHPSTSGLNLFFVDISERKAVEQRLRQLSRAVEQSPALVVITDTVGRIEYVNPKFTEVTGYSPEEVIGRNPRFLNGGDIPSENFRALWKSIKEGGEWRGEFHNKKKNGELYWESATICPILDEKGAISHFIAVKEDITERKNGHIALMEAKHSAEEANRAKDTFLATLSHELRTPLTPVLLTASSFENDDSVTADVRAQFTLIRNNIELEARLIEDLLDLTKIAHGKFTVRQQDLNFAELLETTLEVVREGYLEKKISLQVDKTANATTVFADPARLRQVVWNLLKNAIKFTPSQGMIQIRIFNPDPQHISIQVRDTGVGIHPELLKSIFDPFQQGTATGNPQFGGLGLGLAISKNIVEVHGGTITVASAGPNTGATFTVQLPLSERTLAPSGGTVLPVRSVVRPLRILLVEDNEPTRSVLARLLRKDGHLVQAVGSCAEAFRAAHTQPDGEPFQALVCDLGLPDGNGIDIVLRLKIETPNIAAVALSGFGTDDDIRRSREAGFHEHLVKPASIQDLRRALAA